MKIKEVIVVEGRDDTTAVTRAVECDTIETHGFGIKKETWELIKKAYEERGIIIFTDPDHSGEEIRKKLSERFPNAKHAYLTKKEALGGNDVGIENASDKAICEALNKANPDAVRGSGSGAYFEVGAEIKIPRELEADDKALQGRAWIRQDGIAGRCALQEGCQEQLAQEDRKRQIHQLC